MDTCDSVISQYKILQMKRCATRCLGYLKNFTSAHHVKWQCFSTTNTSNYYNTVTTKNETWAYLHRIYGGLGNSTSSGTSCKSFHDSDLFLVSFN